MIDAIICRTNGGALAQAIAHVSAGQNVKLITGTSKAELMRKISAIRQLLDVGATNLHMDYEDFNRETFAEYLGSSQGRQDKTLVKLLGDYGINVIEQVLDSGARKRRDVINITTAHRSKGLEWDRVMLGDDFPELLEDYENGQEANLLYVAMTRCKTYLDISLCPVLLELYGADRITVKTHKDDATGGVFLASRTTTMGEAQMVACTSCQQDNCKWVGATYAGCKWRHTSPQERWCDDFTPRFEACTCNYCRGR